MHNDPEFSIAYAQHARPTMTYDWNGHSDMPVQSPELSDYEVAGRVRMLMRNQLDHESVCTLARDRIMGLSKLNHGMLLALRECLGALDACVTQIEQMRGMFDDADGTIQEAVDDAEDAEKKAQAVLS